MVSITQARRDLYQRFIDLWGATSAYTFDNEVYNPTAGNAWVRFSVRHDGSELEAIGGTAGGASPGFRKYQRRGRVVVQIFTPENQGAEAADIIVAKVQDLFEGFTLPGNSIRLNDVVVREIGPGEGWYQVNVEAFFKYDERK